MDTSKDMDNLTKDVLAAEKAGMSYGQWKALNYHPEKKVEREPPKKLDCYEEYNWSATCVVCGKEFRKRVWCQKTCSEECRDIWNRDYGKSYREARLRPIHHE